MLDLFFFLKLNGDLVYRCAPQQSAPSRGFGRVQRCGRLRLWCTPSSQETSVCVAVEPWQTRGNCEKRAYLISLIRNVAQSELLMLELRTLCRQGGLWRNSLNRRVDDEGAPAVMVSIERSGFDTAFPKSAAPGVNCCKW